MKRYKVTYESIYSDAVVLMNAEELLKEVNSERSHEWTDYTPEDLENNPDDVFGWFCCAESIEIIS